MADDRDGLTPANENPWYVLSTLHGEQLEEHYDPGLAEQNVRLWNIWACQNLSEEARNALREDGVDVPDKAAWASHQDKIIKRYKEEMRERNPDGFESPDLPDPDQLYDMSKIAFSHTVVWEKAIFAQFASFGSATFTQDAYFDSATFTQGAFFEAATFTQRANFGSATFTRTASFRFATFTQDAYFDSATFTQDVYFDSATFTRTADFGSATFMRDCQFSSATFTHVANFRHATSRERAYFDSATFTQDAYFDSATFTQGADFGSATFKGRAYFLQTQFGDETTDPARAALLDLTDAQLDKPASFRGARFLNRFPEVRGAIIHPGTLFPDDRGAWPTGYPMFDEDWKEGEKAERREGLYRDAAHSCAFLRNHVKRQGHPEAEHYFFRREMGFLGKVGHPLLRLPYWGFWLVSDYGNSIQRPFWWLVPVWVLGFVLFQGCGIADAFCLLETPKARLLSAWEAAGLSFSNMFKFFGFQTLYYRDFLGKDTLGDGYKLLASIQTIASFILLFFLGLGLRQRFRLR